MEFDETIALFRDIDLFADFDDEQLRLLAFVSEFRALQPGEVLYESGDAPDGAYVLASGGLAAHAEGKAELQAAYRITAPALIGELGLVLTRPRATTISVRTPARVLFVPRGPFLKLLRAEPALAASVAEKIRAELARYLDAIAEAGPRFAGEDN